MFLDVTPKEITHDCNLPERFKKGTGRGPKYNVFATSGNLKGKKRGQYQIFFQMGDRPRSVEKCTVDLEGKRNLYSGRKEGGKIKITLFV